MVSFHEKVVALWFGFVLFCFVWIHDCDCDCDCDCA
jgi:hypothetical protein